MQKRFKFQQKSLKRVLIWLNVISLTYLKSYGNSSENPEGTSVDKISAFNKK